jgi:hypothetical protein
MNIDASRRGVSNVGASAASAATRNTLLMATAAADPLIFTRSMGYYRDENAHTRVVCVWPCWSLSADSWCRLGSLLLSKNLETKKKKG